jgi:GT2 family glycosyltransferase
MSVAVSVVIPTCRRPGLLVRCLRALLVQDLKPARYEVIVVDDGADPATRTLVRDAAVSGRCLRIRYIPVTQRRGPAAARNTGWRAARAPVIAFTDDDCIPTRSWLTAGLAGLRPGIAGVSGRIVVPLGRAPTDHARATAGLETAEFATANCFYRRDALVRAGGFDERFTAAWREDADLFLTLLEQKHRLRFVPAAVVIHPVRPAPWGVSIAQQRNSVFNALLYKKHSALYRTRIQRTAPLHYYVIVIPFVLAAVAALTPWRTYAPVPAAAGAAGVLLFCARRLRGTSHAPAHILEMLVTSAAIPFLSLFWRLRGAVRYTVIFY